MLDNNQIRKTALLTGVTSGIGRELTHLFADGGHNLILVARNQSKLASLEKELREKYHDLSIHGIVQNLADPNSPWTIQAAVRNMQVNVDILVNNAGFNVYGSLDQTSIDEQNRLIQVNAITPTMLTKLFLPDMLTKKSGKILFLGSTASYCPAMYSAVYCASKAYVLSFSESLAMELQGSGVTVTCLCPGATQTEFAEKANLKKTRLFNIAVMDAKSVAKIGYHSLLRERPVVVSGLLNNMLVKSIKLTPRCIATPVTRYLMSEQ